MGTIPRLISLVGLALVALPSNAVAKCPEYDVAPDPRMVAEPLPAGYTGAIELLRRPQRPEDALERPFPDAVKLSPTTSRLLIGGSGVRVWVYGAMYGKDRLTLRCRRQLSPAGRRRERQQYERRLAQPLRLAYTYVADTLGSGAGYLGRLSDIRANKAIDTFEGEEQPYGTAFGLVPDGVATVEATFPRTCSDEPPFDRTLTVAQNGWVATFPNRVAPPIRTTWRAADGSVVATFARRFTALRCID